MYIYYVIENFLEHFKISLFGLILVFKLLMLDGGGTSIKFCLDF